MGEALLAAGPLAGRCCLGRNSGRKGGALARPRGPPSWSRGGLVIFITVGPMQRQGWHCSSTAYTVGDGLCLLGCGGRQAGLRLAWGAAAAMLVLLV